MFTNPVPRRSGGPQSRLPGIARHTATFRVHPARLIGCLGVEAGRERHARRKGTEATPSERVNVIALLTRAPSSDTLFTPRFFVMCSFTLHRLSLRIPAAADRPLPHSRTWRDHVRVRPLPGLPDIRIGVLGAADRRPRGSHRPPADAVDLERRDYVVLDRVCGDVQLPRDARRSRSCTGCSGRDLLSASSAYMTGLLPERRRAEGIGYWGLSSVAAIAVAPPLAFWIMQRGGWSLDLHQLRRA